jgi:hypothetical protein
MYIAQEIMLMGMAEAEEKLQSARRRNQKIIVDYVL